MPQTLISLVSMGVEQGTYIIAEVGVNHNGRVDLATQLIDTAVEAGADAVKFQTFDSRKLVTSGAEKAPYQEERDSSSSQRTMLEKLELSRGEHRLLRQYCEKMGIDFLSTPFDGESLDFLVNEIGVSRIKVASGELTNAPFLLEIARKKKPIILSTGMSTLEEVGTALALIEFGRNHDQGHPDLAKIQYKKGTLRDVTVLHCTTSYPTEPADANLLAMQTMQKEFGVSVGYSDHTLGLGVPIAAVALGAQVIEKHITLDRKMEGPDHAASMEPRLFSELVRGIRAAEQAFGSGEKRPTEGELKNRVAGRKSVVASAAIKKGEVFTEKNITTMRPGDGISPFSFWNVLGKKATKDYLPEDRVEL